MAPAFQCHPVVQLPVVCAHVVPSEGVHLVTDEYVLIKEEPVLHCYFDFLISSNLLSPKIEHDVSVLSVTSEEQKLSFLDLHYSNLEPPR